MIARRALRPRIRAIAHGLIDRFGHRCEVDFVERMFPPCRPPRRSLWSAVCLYPALIPGAVAECLRYEPSVGSFPRITLDDIEIGGRIVPRNRVLSLSTLSAMRDPELYADADSFNIRRIDHPRKHPVFGFGVHRCLGEVASRRRKRKPATLNGGPSVGA